jgi:hypothetical protein
VLTSLPIEVPDGRGHFDVYEQNFSAGTVTLGGNLAIGAVGAVSNYIVIVQPLSPGVCTDADFDTYYTESGCETALDCDDSDFSVHPEATEMCDDGEDNDCDRAVDCADPDCEGHIACPDNVTIVSPSDYVVASLQVGDEYYLDRSFTLISIPCELSTGTEEWIMTRNNDKTDTTSSFLEFTISQDSVVYVGYDSRSTSLPSWLADTFVLTSLTIEVPDGMGHFDVYEQNFSAGTVTLGGNLAIGAVGAVSNYIVIVERYYSP